MRATVVLEADRDEVERWFAEVGLEPPFPDPFEWFVARVKELVADEFSVATSPNPLRVRATGDFRARAL